MTLVDIIVSKTDGGPPEILVGVHVATDATPGLRVMSDGNLRILPNDGAGGWCPCGQIIVHVGVVDLDGLRRLIAQGLRQRLVSFLVKGRESMYQDGTLDLGELRELLERQLGRKPRCIRPCSELASQPLSLDEQKALGCLMKEAEDLINEADEFLK